MIKTKATKGRMTLREAIQAGGRGITMVERNKNRPRGGVRLLYQRRIPDRIIDRVPIRVQPVRIRVI